MTQKQLVAYSGRFGTLGWRLRIASSFLPFVRVERLSPNAIALASWPTHTYGASWTARCDTI